MTFISKLILLLGAHALADYPLQGEFLSRHKDHTLGTCARCRNPIKKTGSTRWGLEEKPWEICTAGCWHAPPPHPLGWQKSMLAHCLIHAAFVQAITGMWQLAVAEFTIHWITDYAKCDGRINSNTDQAIHYLCKILWAVL